MANRRRFSSADPSAEGVVKPKVLSASPALSYISTVAPSEVEVLEFSDDEECGADEPSEAFQWCLVGSRIAPVFASLMEGNVLEDTPVHQSPDVVRPSPVTNDHGDAQWRHVGLRLAAVMKEAMDQNDVEDDEEELNLGVQVHTSGSLRASTDAEEHSWRLVGLRLAHLFSSLDCDGETLLPATHAGAVTALSNSGGAEYPQACSLETHERWQTVGSRLSAVLKTAAQ